jgi:hypothetical protein
MREKKRKKDLKKFNILNPLNFDVILLYLFSYVLEFSF